MMHITHIVAADSLLQGIIIIAHFVRIDSWTKPIQSYSQLSQPTS